MAVCPSCDRDMTTASSCTDTAYAAPYTDIEARCRDCNVAAGGLHHPGCLVGRCAVCGMVHEHHAHKIARDLERRPRVEGPRQPPRPHGWGTTAA